MAKIELLVLSFSLKILILFSSFENLEIILDFSFLFTSHMQLISKFWQLYLNLITSLHGYQHF